MKRKSLNALIATSVAVAGVLATTSTALSLYIATDQTSANISITTNADVTLRMSEPFVSSLPQRYIGPRMPSITYSYALGGEIHTGSTYTQDIVMGNLDIEVKPSNPNVLDYITVSNKINYTNDGNPTFWSENKSTMIFEKDNVENPTSLKGSTFAPAYVNGTRVEFTIGLNELGLSNFIDIAETTYEITFNYRTIDEDFVVPYVVGGIDGWGWQKTDAGMMVPNLMSSVEDGYQWMWVADQDYGESEFKVVNGETWYPEGFNNNMTANILAGDQIYFTNNVVSFYHPTN